VTRIGDDRAYRILVGNLKERARLEYPDVYRRMILKWILKNCDGSAWTEFSFLSMKIAFGGNGNET
jgi:hypothetical protein